MVWRDEFVNKSPEFRKYLISDRTSLRPFRIEFPFISRTIEIKFATIKFLHNDVIEVLELERP